MNLLNKCTTNEIKLLKNIGLNVEDKDYSREELRKYEIFSISIKFIVVGVHS